MTASEIERAGTGGDAIQQQLLRYAHDLQDLVAQHTQLAQRYKRVLEKLRVGRGSSNQLLNMALHDRLTGLPNRYLLEESMETALLAAELDPSAGAGIFLLYLDLDRFKPINDELGHAAGDEVLVVVARRMQAQVRSCDTVARLGGDEFVVLLQGLKSPEVAHRIAGTLSQVVQRPMEVAGKIISVGVSIGMAQCAVDGSDLASLLQKSDEDMYRVKRARAVSLDNGPAASQHA